MRESYHPTQDDWAKRAPAEIQALAEKHPELAGYWSDQQIKEDVLAFLSDEYGITNAVFVSPEPPQPEVPIQEIRLEPSTATDGVAKK